MNKNLEGITTDDYLREVFSWGSKVTTILLMTEYVADYLQVFGLDPTQTNPTIKNYTGLVAKTLVMPMRRHGILNDEEKDLPDSWKSADLVERLSLKLYHHPQALEFNQVLIVDI